MHERTVEVMCTYVDITINIIVSIVIIFVISCTCNQHTHTHIAVQTQVRIHAWMHRGIQVHQHIRTYIHRCIHPSFHTDMHARSRGSQQLLALRCFAEQAKYHEPDNRVAFGLSESSVTKLRYVLAASPRPVLLEVFQQAKSQFVDWGDLKWAPEGYMALKAPECSILLLLLVA